VRLIVATISIAAKFTVAAPLSGLPLNFTVGPPIEKEVENGAMEIF
jgi:hypothetical protein